MKRWFYPLIAIVLSISVFLDAVLRYLTDNLGVSINVILYTLTGPLDGANTDFLKGTVKYIVAAVVALAAVLAALYVIDRFLRRIRIAVSGKINDRAVDIDLLAVFT